MFLFFSRRSHCAGGGLASLEKWDSGAHLRQSSEVSVGNEAERKGDVVLPTDFWRLDLGYRS